jgi:hypothetical protein
MRREGELMTVSITQASVARTAARKALARLCDGGHLTEESYLWADWELEYRRVTPAAVAAELVEKRAITADGAAGVMEQ